MTAPARPAARASTAHLPREVRIIGGHLRRSRLPVADRPGLRPTPDRVRETLFNWLGQDLTGWRVLDAFAGSGALGFEAASRGAAQVLLIERDAALARSLSATAARLQAAPVRVVCADALRWMRAAAAAAFDLVLLDPPFDTDEHGADGLAGTIAAAAPLVAAGGRLYVEAGQPLVEAALPAGWRLSRQGRAGAVHYHLLDRPPPDGTPGPSPLEKAVP